MNKLFRFPITKKHDEQIENWMNEHSDILGSIAASWFEVLRNCGNDVHEILHDGQPTACVEDVAFAYVDVYKLHVNVGFFNGAELNDPDGLLEGAGKYMRHVKLNPGKMIDKDTLLKLINTAYTDIKRRLKSE